ASCRLSVYGYIFTLPLRQQQPTIALLILWTNHASRGRRLVGRCARPDAPLLVSHRKAPENIKTVLWFFHEPPVFPDPFTRMPTWRFEINAAHRHANKAHKKMFVFP
ncbi:unnamed protein product, partial [Ectocarpus sp. 8 AP-2014]